MSSKFVRMLVETLYTVLYLVVNLVKPLDCFKYSRYSPEEKLVKDLLMGYNELIIPTVDNSQSVKVFIYY